MNTNSGKNRNEKNPDGTHYPEQGFNDGYGSYDGQPRSYDEDHNLHRINTSRQNENNPYSNEGASGGEYSYYPPSSYNGGDSQNAYGKDQDSAFGNRQGLNKGKGPRNYKRSDERIKEEINERLTEDHHVDAVEIEVKVQNGEVTLSGTVNGRSEKRRAEDIAESVSGVTHVENRLRVTPTVSSSDRNY
jgi:hypothetical protein